jgi:hypothetical protein
LGALILKPGHFTFHYSSISQVSTLAIVGTLEALGGMAVASATTPPLTVDANAMHSLDAARRCTFWLRGGIRGRERIEGDR